MSFSAQQPTPPARSRQPEPQSRPDFENNLAEFQLELLEFVAETDPNFDLDMLRNNPNPAVAVPVTEGPGELLHPRTKEDLSLPLHLSGPKVVNGDIFGDKVLLESEVRVRGSVYGRSEVQIGPSCVVEGSVVSGGALEISEGSRIEGAAVGSEIRLVGPVHIEGPVHSRGGLTCQGRLEAQTIYASSKISLLGDPGIDAVRLESGLIMTKDGDIESDIPVWLADVEVRTDRQKFYVNPDETGDFRLIRAYTATPVVGKGYSTILTTLTDAELEKLVADLAKIQG
jgi:cytoskeletal protein CcmA (bactofilin family)